MKKLVGILLTLAMVVAMSITTFAATATCTITGPGNGHTYEVYQIFTGTYTLDNNTKILSDVAWGINSKHEENVTAASAVEELEKAKSENDAKKLEAIETYVNFKTTPVATITNTDSTVTVPQGYYLIKDTSLPRDDNGDPSDPSETYSRNIVMVAGDITIAPKAEKPSSYKKVKDANDSSTEINGDQWIDSADYDIGDKVPFQLTGVVAADYESYKGPYKFVFHDQESAGLTFDAKTVKVYVDGTRLDSGYSVSAPAEDGDTFDVKFDNLKEITEVKAGSVITVEYESTLNDKAVIGSTGNPNTMHLEYSNNPNNEQGGETGKTPDDKVIVFTYKLVINKKDEKGNILPGADFKLEKKNPDGKTWSEVTRKITELVTELEGVETVTLVKDNTKYTATRFTFTGLDDGEYKLTETQTPAGYNTIAPITFTVTAKHDILADNPSLTDLNGEASKTGEITLTPMEEDGSLTTNIVNKAGSTLPETGGMGTTILYVVGAILVIGAGILLVTKKRMNTNK